MRMTWFKRSTFLSSWVAEALTNPFPVCWFYRYQTSLFPLCQCGRASLQRIRWSTPLKWLVWLSAPCLASSIRRPSPSAPFGISCGATTTASSSWPRMWCRPRTSCPTIYSASLLAYVCSHHHYILSPIRTNGWWQEERYFLFPQKNGSTADGTFTISTGVDSVANYAAIDNWNGMSKLPFWQSDKCNKIVGTDGTAYPPDLTPNTTFHLFNPEICRSLPLVYHKDVVHDGVAGKVFTRPGHKKLFDDIFKVCRTPLVLFTSHFLPKAIVSALRSTRSTHRQRIQTTLVFARLVRWAIRAARKGSLTLVPANLAHPWPFPGRISFTETQNCSRMLKVCPRIQIATVSTSTFNRYVVVITPCNSDGLFNLWLTTRLLFVHVEIVHRHVRQSPYAD